MSSTPHPLPTDPQPADYGIRPLLTLDGDPLGAPPHFEGLIGYDGDRRHLALYWCAGDCPVLEDGVTSQTGHYGPWLIWSRHPTVQPSLVGVDVGSCDSPPVHHILLDRFSRRIFVGLAADVARFLSDAPDLQAERKAWEALSEKEREEQRRRAGEAMREVLGGLLDLGTWEETTEQARTRMRAAEPLERSAVARLHEWLDARPLTCPACLTPHPAGDYDSEDSGVPSCPSCREPFYSQALVDRLAALRARSTSGPPTPPTEP